MNSTKNCALLIWCWGRKIEKVLSETPNDTTCRFLLTIESVIRDRDGMNSEGTENMKGQIEHQKALDYAGTYKRI